jgi:micrococcal nuclease
VKTAVVATVVGTLALGAVVAQATPSAASSDQMATVIRVVDGDTVDVRYALEKHRIRLLNIDAPESVDPAKPVECLGPEASAYLKSLLPAGTPVTLRHDRVKHDKYGRELAAVFVGGRLVDAEVARAGLADAIVIRPNDRYYAEVLAAQRQARAAKVGLYSESIACTVPAKVAAYESASAAVVAGQPQPGAGPDAFDAYAASLASLVASGDALQSMLSADVSDRQFLGLNAGRVRTLVTRATTARAQVADLAIATRSARAEEAGRIQAEQEAAAARAAAEAQAAAAAAAAKAQVKAPKSGPAAVAPKPKHAAPGPKGVAPHPAAPRVDPYTGCRAYGPKGTSTDAKGRPYTKIDCKTKLPIG